MKTTSRPHPLAEFAGTTVALLLFLAAGWSLLSTVRLFTRDSPQTPTQVCVGNVFKLSTAILEYTQDYDERFPTGSGPVNAGKLET